jgi:hypothetical protein
MTAFYLQKVWISCLIRHIHLLPDFLLDAILIPWLSHNKFVLAFCRNPHYFVVYKLSNHQENGKPL